MAMKLDSGRGDTEATAQSREILPWNSIHIEINWGCLWEWNRK